MARPVLFVLIAIASVQFGAAVAKGIFHAAHPATLSFLRVLIGTAIFLAIARPRLTGRTPKDWLVAAGYGICLAGMNLAIYLSFARIPIGVAVTLEFIGPLALAVLGSRRALDLLWVALAAGGVVLLGALPTGLDPVGVALALLAGAMWAGYIALAGPVARRWEGLSGLTVGSVIGLAGLAVPGLALSGDALGSPTVWGTMAAVALLSTVIPYGLELNARRSIKASTFGILMSLEPAAAALFAWLVLRERLGWLEWLAMALVVAASIGAVRTARRRVMGRKPSGTPALKALDQAGVTYIAREYEHDPARLVSGWKQPTRSASSRAGCSRRCSPPTARNWSSVSCRSTRSSISARSPSR